MRWEPLGLHPPMYQALLPYPDIDPVLIHLGPLAIRWYALAYISGQIGRAHV